MKIFLSGASGSGKTTLAKHLAEQLNLEYIDGSSKALWKTFYIQNHLEAIRLCLNDSYIGSIFQEELFKHRAKLIKDKDNFVMDRSFLDSVYYAIHQMGPNSAVTWLPKFIKHNQKELAKHVGPDTFQLVTLLPPNDKTFLEQDGSRITNLPYQRMVEQGIFYTYHEYIESTGLPIYLAPYTNNVDKRFNLVIKTLKGRR